MNFLARTPPRHFSVGKRKGILLSDCGSVFLAPDEQVALVDGEGRALAVVAKSWGYCMTPSINSRLIRMGYKTALTMNSGRIGIKVVDKERRKEFEEYILEEGGEIIEWLDERHAITDNQQ